MNHDDKKEKTEEIFFNNLFEKKEKEQNEQLYKNEFYVLEEEMKTNKDQNSLQFMHDALLNKLMLEDYSPFPPKNDEPTIVNNQKDEKKKEDEQDKLIEEENEFLRNLHLITYLTFSPFGQSFFEDNNKDNQNLGEDYQKEKEEKILHMIGFDYSNFEVTNDLLLYICQGFIDINKLKEENLTNNKIKTNNSNINSNNENINNKLVSDVGNIPIREKKESEKEEDEISEDELYESVSKKRKIDFYKSIIKKYDNDLENLSKSNKKNFVNKWKAKFKEKEKEYEEHLKKLKEEEEKKKQEEKKLREIEKRKEKKKLEQERSQIELKKGLESILQKAQKRGMISKSSNKIKRRPKAKWDESLKKSLNHSMISNRNLGNTSIISKVNLNKSVISSSKNKKTDRSIKKKLNK